MPFGIAIENTVITKPYSISIDVSFDELTNSKDESFFVFIDRYGKWRINTILKGFAENLSGFASTLSRTGDIILIGKNKNDMMLAFKRVKEIGGGIVIIEKGKIVIVNIKINSSEVAKRSHKKIIDFFFMGAELIE